MSTLLETTPHLDEDVFGEQQEVLEDLLARLLLPVEKQRRARDLLRRGQVIDRVVDMTSILNSLDIFDDHSNGEFRLQPPKVRKFLTAAYPLQPFPSYNKPYILDVYKVLPWIALANRENFNIRTKGGLENNLRRLSKWVIGISLEQMAQQEYVSKLTIDGRIRNFPPMLGRAVSFYDLTRAADLLGDIQDLSSVNR